MRRLVLFGLIVLAGCEGVIGPRERACRPSSLDAPCLSPDEQKARLRDEVALPLNSPAIGPRTYAEGVTR